MSYLKEHSKTFAALGLTVAGALLTKLRGFKMEDKIALGSAGSLTLSFSGGKATISAQASVDGGAVAVNASLVGDAGLLIDQLEAIVAKALPATAPIDPAIFGAIKLAVLAIN